MVLAGRHRKVGHSFNTQLIPDVPQVVRLVKLHLVCYNAGAKSFVRSVLQVPACLLLLHVLSNHCATLAGLALAGYGVPHLEVLDGVAFFILGRALPGDDVGAERREAELKDVRGGKRGDELARECVDDRNPAQTRVSGYWLDRRLVGSGLLFGRCPRKISAVGRVAAASQVALGPGGRLAGRDRRRAGSTRTGRSLEAVRRRALR